MDERGFPYCLAHLVGRKGCKCPMCRNELKIRRHNNWIVWGSVLLFAIVVGLGLFSARSADCRGTCFGTCNTNVGCPGANCGCVPTMPRSPLGTCVGSG
jgi:hypothetical protein